MKKSISKTHRILFSPNGFVHGLVKKNFLNVSFYVKNTAKKCLVTFWLKNKPV